MNSPIRIAVLGRGKIGGTLGAKWAAAGHQVVYGVRDPSSSKSRSGSAAAGTGARTDTIANAIRFGHVIVIAVPAGAVEETVAAHGAALDGKIVVDATNRFGAPVVNNIAAITAAAPQAVIFRAFNSIGWENFAEPVIDGEQADLFYCGPEGDSRSVVEKLIADVGLRPVRVGGLETAPLVDNVGALWVALVFGQHKRRHMAFRLLGG
jgi:predicted dinucleotide-binding enzyme